MDFESFLFRFCRRKKDPSPRTSLSEKSAGKGNFSTFIFNIMKRISVVFCFFLLLLPAFSVLKERDLARTLGVLRAELEQNHAEKKAYIKRLEDESRNQHAQLVDYMQRSEQIALMLYSQKEDYTFDISYACGQATELYRLLTDELLPFSTTQKQLRTEIDRYARLVRSLEELPPAVTRGEDVSLNTQVVSAALDTLTINAEQAKLVADSINLLSEAYTLTPKQREDRAVALKILKELQRRLQTLDERLNRDKAYYIAVKEKVERLNSYAMARYKQMQQSIFLTGGQNYFGILRNFSNAYTIAKSDLVQKYSSLDGLPSTYSEWRGPVVTFMLLFILGYVAVAIALSNAILRLMPRRWLPADFRRKRPIYFTALGLFFFAASIMLVRLFVDRSFILMALGLMTNIAWLALAVVVSLLVRLNVRQVGLGLRLYLPFIIMAFIVVSFRVLFVPNTVVALLFPPLLLIFSVWQVRTLRVPKGSMPTSDILYSAVAMMAMCVATVMAWTGFVLMAVQVMVWWMFQLAATQTIMGGYYLMERYERIFVLRKIKAHLSDTGGDIVGDEVLLLRVRTGAYIPRTWSFDFVKRALLPTLGVLSVPLSVWYAAGVFEMTDVVREFFDYNFIDRKGVIQLSLLKLTLVGSLWFVFRYLNYAARSFYQHITKMRNRLPDYQYNFTLANNVIAILVWGAYVLYALILLQVPKSGISIVTAGLATGMGFAMKDLLENFFYGISLMTGRIRVGDFIECDGVTGRVESISYQSTQVTTLDGSVIAFLNTQLFNKNFKNLTRNNAYEMVKIPVGVAYGSDVEQVRRLIIASLEPLNEPLPDGRSLFKPDTDIGVSFAEFGESSVNLTVWFWVLVEVRAGTLSRAREAIYNTLNRNNIEIPFPQLDVHTR